MGCKLCGADANGGYLCDACNNTWTTSPEWCRWRGTAADDDDAIRETALADFVQRVRATRENGGRHGAKEVTT